MFLNILNGSSSNGYPMRSYDKFSKIVGVTISILNWVTKIYQNNIDMQQ